MAVSQEAQTSQLQQISSAQQQQQQPTTASSIKQHIAAYEHCLDFQQMHSLNKLRADMGMSPLFCMVNSSKLNDAVDALNPATLASKVPETPPPGMEEIPCSITNLGDWDEDVLLDECDQWQPAKQCKAAELSDQAIAAESAAEAVAAAAAAAAQAKAAAAAQAKAAAAAQTKAVAAARVGAPATAATTSDVELAAAEKESSEQQQTDRCTKVCGEHAAADVTLTGCKCGLHHLAATMSPTNSSKRRASAGVGAAVLAELSSDEDIRDVDMTDQMVPDSLARSCGEPSLSPQQQAAADIAIAAAGARDSGKSRTGSTSRSNKRRRKPNFVAERIPAARQLHYRDFIGPVKTDEEQLLFQQLVEQHCSNSRGGAVSDWTAFTRDWNLAAYKNLVTAGGKVITFKQVAHLKDYNKKITKAASQVHTAAMAAGTSQAMQQEEPATPAATLAAALQDIIAECIPSLQPQVDSSCAEPQQVPAALQQLLQLLAACVNPTAATAARPTTTAAAAAPVAVEELVLDAEAVDVDVPVAFAGLTDAGRDTSEQATTSTAVAAGAESGTATAMGKKAATNQGLAKSTGAFAAIMQGRGKNSKPARVSKATGKPVQAGVGKGKGGASARKVCIPCTLVKLKLHRMADAKSHAEAVIMDAAHQPNGAQPCVYCKCSECKKKWHKQGHISDHAFVLTADCPHPEK